MVTIMLLGISRIPQHHIFKSTKAGINSTQTSTTLGIAKQVAQRMETCIPTSSNAAATKWYEKTKKNADTKLQQVTDVQPKAKGTTARNDRPSNQEENRTNETGEETIALRKPTQPRTRKEQHKIPASPTWI